MRLFVILTVVAVALAEEKHTDKRGADVTYATATPKTQYATATQASASTPTYTKGLQQAYLKNYVQPAAYEQTQQVKYAYAAQPQLQVQAQAYKVAAAPVAYSQPQYQYQYEQPQVSYVQQPELKYAFAQPAKLANVAQKIQYSAPSSVAYQSAAPAYSAQVAAPVAPHYSSAGQVSSFHFSNPHVTYSNLGLLSQVVGNGYSSKTASQGPAQVQYSAAPAQVQYSAPQVQYSAPQVQYSQVSAAPQVQYVQASQYSPQQYQAQQYQAAPQVQYVQQAAHSAPQYIYSSPPKGYSGNVQYAH